MNQVSMPRLSAEELVSSLPHGAGWILSTAGLPVLLFLAVMRGSAWRIVGCAIYGSTFLCLRVVSTLSHGIRCRRVKRILGIRGHSVISLRIGETYTPFLLVNVRGSRGQFMFAPSGDRQ